MKITVRQFNLKTDYEQVSKLYKDSKTFGGQYDEARDSQEKLRNLSKEKPDCILVAVEDRKIVGTVTIFEDGRTAWLFRFAVQQESEIEISKELYTEAKKVLQKRGHSQVLVLAPNNGSFDNRYKKLGFNKGNDFTAYWQDLK